MNDLQNQTDQILVWLKSIDHGIQQLALPTMISCVLLLAIFLVVAFRRPRPARSRLSPDELEEAFIRHVEEVDKNHPDWLKGERHGPTSLMAIAREFWNAGRKSR